MKLNPKHHNWLGGKPVLRVFEALSEGQARFVGGCVRNALLGVPVSDYDIATTLEPKAVSRALKSAGIAVHETGLSHGTLTAVADHEVFEITTLRRDVSTDGRRANVAFTKDWAEDAQRRDFTINALYCDLEGNIFDPCGQSLADIKAKRLRFVGSAKGRIKEDYLRILRYFRLQAQYFDTEIMDKEALSACRELKTGLKKLSAERIWSEVKKLLATPAPFRTVNVMLVNGILEILLPEASNSEGLQLICELEMEMGLAVDPYFRLMAMSARDEFAMAGLCRRLKMSKKEKTRLMQWAGDQTALKPSLPEKDLKIAIYKAGRQTAIDRALLRAAGASESMIRNEWLNIYKTARDWDWPKFPIAGKDLIAAGIASGPKVGTVMAALEALWVRSGFNATKQALLAALIMINR